MSEDRSTLIKEETVARRDFCRKVRSILRVALEKGTRTGYKHGCLAALAVVDQIDPVGKGFYVVRQTFAPGHEHPGPAR